RLLFESISMKVFVIFALVGAAGVGLNFLVTYVLKEKIRAPKYLSNAIGFLFGVSLNYTLNRNITFESDNVIWKELMVYLLVVLIGLIINHFVVYLGHQKWKWNFYLSKVVAVCVVFLWNFVMHSNFTFS
ncbi:MAG: GtrA family protein, partial [Bacteroidota bacterium]